MKHQYESEILYRLMERDGFNIPSSVPPYESEIKAYLINQVKQAYPKLTDYEAEWLLYNYTHHLPADFPISSVTDVTTATFENVVPFAYQSAILKGSTKYRDIDTGEVLDAFEDGRNLELVSVRMPVLTTTGKNLFDIKNIDKFYQSTNKVTNTYKIRLKPNTNYTMSSNVPVTIPASIYFNETKTDENGVYINVPKTAMSDNDGNLFFYIRVDDLTGIKLENFINNEYYIQLEEGSNATSYEPFKSNILTVNEDVELRGIGDVQDTLDCLTGQVTERTSEIVLDGSENWIKWGSGFLLQGYLSNPMFVSGATNDIRTSYVKCDRFPSIIYSDVYGGASYGVSINGGNVGISVNGISTLEAFKTNLSENPIKICYPVANKSIKTVDLNTVNESGETVYFMPLEGTMHVSSSSSTIKPLIDMSVPVEATTQNLASFINLEMED